VENNPVEHQLVLSRHAKKLLKTNSPRWRKDFRSLV
jgi:hypothetical protein